MTYVFLVEDKKRSPNFGKEIAYPVTVLDVPPMTICAIKAYTKEMNVLRTLTEVWASGLSKDFKRLKGVPRKGEPDKNLKKIEENIDKIVEFRIIAATQPRLTGISKKKPDIMEIKVGGATMKEQFQYIKEILGKTVEVNDIFKEGQFVDTVSVTKGKGWQGVVKRWGVRILQHKANKTKRGIATLGPWGPARVLYTVPRAGQMGYHQRTEFNKRILKIGKDGNQVTPKSGFLHYGPVRSTFVILSGSIAGPAKRLIRLRYPARPPKKVEELSPQITHISLKSLQGA
jgi:large subunit ribosomal protein L3